MISTKPLGFGEYEIDIRYVISLQRPVRDIAGRAWDQQQQYSYDERFCYDRELTITAIPAHGPSASHAVIGISGTPVRGLLVVDLKYDDEPFFDVVAGKRINNPKERALLCSFISAACGRALTIVRPDFRWSSLVDLPNHKP